MDRGASRWLNVEQPRSAVSPQVRTHNIFIVCSFLSDPFHLSNSIAQAQRSTGFEDCLCRPLSTPSHQVNHSVCSFSHLSAPFTLPRSPSQPPHMFFPLIVLLCSCFSASVSLLIIFKQECPAILLIGPIMVSQHLAFVRAAFISTTYTCDPPP